jgi:hypothetical protein
LVCKWIPSSVRIGREAVSRPARHGVDLREYKRAAKLSGFSWQLDCKVRVVELELKSDEKGEKRGCYMREWKGVVAGDGDERNDCPPEERIEKRPSIAALKTCPKLLIFDLTTLLLT